MIIHIFMDVNTIFNKFMDLWILHNFGGGFLYESLNVAEMIKKTALSKNIQIKTVLSTLNLNKNTLSNMYKGSMLKSDSLARIADCLNCSVDYLLGRTDNPEINTGKSVVNNGSISGNVGTKATINVSGGSECVLSKECAELLHIYESLDARSSVQLLNFAFELADKSAESENLN